MIHKQRGATPLPSRGGARGGVCNCPLFIALTAMLLALGACTDENTFQVKDYEPSLVGYYLHLSTDNITLGAAKPLTQQAQVESQGTSWQFNGMNESWLSITPKNGDADATVDFSATENCSGEDIRTSVFFFESSNANFPYSRQVAVTQGHASPSIHISDNAFTISAAKRTITVDVVANVEWDVLVNKSWLQVEKGADNKTLTISVEENLTKNSRQAHVNITGNAPAVISISQSQATPPKVSSDKIEIQHTGGDYPLEVTSEVAWKVLTSESWLTTSVSGAGAGTTQIDVSAGSNESSMTRSAFIYIYIGDDQVFTIPVLQKALSLQVSPAALIFKADAETQTMQVSSNTSWEVLEKPDWVEVSPMKGTGNAEITIHVNDYWSSSEKVGTLRMGKKGTDLEKTISVKQLGRTVPTLKDQLIFGSEADTQEVPIETDAKWTVSSDGSSWMHVSPSSGIGNGRLKVSVDENTEETERHAMINVAIADVTQQMEIIQKGIFTYIEVEEQSVPLTAAKQQVTVGVLSNVSWTATSTAEEWLSVATADDGKAITLTVEENLTDSQRQAEVRIAGSNITKTITVTQAKPNAPVPERTNPLEYDHTGGTYELAITSEVAWTAGTFDDWLEVTPTEGTAGQHSLYITAAPYQTTGSRSGSIYISIGGRRQVTIPVKQSGIYIELTESELSFTADKQEKELLVNSNTSWSVLEKPEWITVTPQEGNGTQTLRLSAEDYWNTTERRGVLKIGQQGTNIQAEATIIQQGRNFPNVVSLLSFDSEADTKEVEVKTDGRWTATTDATWIVLDPKQGKGNSTMKVTVTENIGEGEREDIITISVGDMSQNILVKQEGKFFDVNPTSMTQLTSRGGTHAVNISTNEQWQATSSSSWMQLSPRYGKGNATLKLTAPDNPSINGRKDTTTIAPQHLQAVRIITQQAARYLTVDVSSINFLTKGGTSETVHVNTDADYTVTAKQSWLTIKQTGDSFTVTATKNETGQDREGKVVVAMTGLVAGEAYSVELTVKQCYDSSGITIDTFDVDEQWDIVKTGNATITITGFGSDEQWD